MQTEKLRHGLFIQRLHKKILLWCIFFPLIFPFFRLALLSWAGRERIGGLQGCVSPVCLDTTFLSFLRVCRVSLGSAALSAGGCNLRSTLRRGSQI